MNQDIMAIPNKLIYSGRLKCGSEEVRNQKLILPRKIAPCGCSLAKLLEEEYVDFGRHTRHRSADGRYPH